MCKYVSCAVLLLVHEYFLIFFQKSSQSDRMLVTTVYTTCVCVAMVIGHALCANYTCKYTEVNCMYSFYTKNIDDLFTFSFYKIYTFSITKYR